MLIAHITDTHIVAGSALVFGGEADTSRRLRDAVEFIERLTPKPDIVLATGDLVDNGDPEDYRQLMQLLAPLGMPTSAFARIRTCAARAPRRWRESSARM